MKEKLTLSDLNGLLTLTREKSVRASVLPRRLLTMLLSEHLVMQQREGRSLIVSAPHPELILGFARRLAGTDDLEAYRSLLESREAGLQPTRTESAQVVNNTKAFGTDVMKGIRLNAIKPVAVRYAGKDFLIATLPGMAVEIDEQSLLEIDPGIVVVGVENYSSFMRIKDYAYLFRDDKPYIFTYRSTGGKDTYGKWIEWLKRIPNRYVHFGDLDKGGLKIYIDSFRSVLGDRAEFLIPDDYEEIIRNGSTKLYNEQYGQAAPDVSKDPRIKPLLETIERHHKSCEQEKLARPEKR